MVIAAGRGSSACQSTSVGGSSGPDSSSTTTPATDDLEGSITVAGTAAQVGHYEAWHAEFEVRHPDARVAFEPVSRDEAIRRFADGRAEIVATDRPLTARERRRAARSDLVGLPWRYCGHWFLLTTQ